MRRREFIAGLASAATISPVVASAEQGDRPRRVDVLIAAATENDPYNEGRVAALTDALRGLGWIDGRNLKLVVHRMTANAGDIRKNVTELLSSRPDVVVSGGNMTTGTVLQATHSVPIVFTTAVDPVGAGFLRALRSRGAM
jgi:putative tryptophan/tyrosine transport system substrate-binding protein